MKRERITFTVRQDLLKKLDGLVDKENIRNRSHALEVVLDEKFTSKIGKAVILASGAGVEMRPFTYEMPKPLIPVAGKPLLQHTIEMLKSYGVGEIVITVSYLADQIKNYFGDGKKFGVRIKYVTEEKPSGTGGALKAAQKYLGKNDFLMMYGDVLLDLDVLEFWQAHLEQPQALATLALTSVADPSAYGSVRMRGLQVTDFHEKPDLKHDTSRLVFAGVAAFKNEIFKHLPKKKSFSLEEDVLAKLVKSDQVMGYPFSGHWFDVSTSEVYDRVIKHYVRSV